MSDLQVRGGPSALGTVRDDLGEHLAHGKPSQGVASGRAASRPRGSRAALCRSDEENVKSRVRPRQTHHEKAALTDRTLDFDAAFQDLGEVFDDCQAQTGAAQLTGAGFVDAVKSLEYPRKVVSGNAGPVVRHLQAYLVAATVPVDAD